MTGGISSLNTMENIDGDFHCPSRDGNILIHYQPTSHFVAGCLPDLSLRDEDPHLIRRFKYPV